MSWACAARFKQASVLKIEIARVASTGPIQPASAPSIDWHVRWGAMQEPWHTRLRHARAAVMARGGELG
jgi:hypothetical protein